MTILLTGASGYIGTLVIERLLGEDANGKGTAGATDKAAALGANPITRIICIDEREPSAEKRNNPRLEWIIADLAEHEWTEKIPANQNIDVVIHCAFKIRNPYGAAATKATEENNLADCLNVFAFTFDRAIPKLVYLSSVAAYGAKPSNIGKLLSEDTPIDETENPYGYQKAVSEKILYSLMAEKKPATNVFVLRLNSITGPRGQSMASKFGLITFLRKLLPFVIQANPAWARQFVHEDDLVSIITLLAMKGLTTGSGGTSDAAPANTTTNASLNNGAEIFNIAPEKFLTAKDMSTMLHKMRLIIPAWSVKPLFWIAWNVSHGKIPTRPDSAMGLIYPINVDGSRIEKMTGFHYAHTAEEAFLAK